MDSKPVPTKTPKLTFKQKKFLKLYFKTGNATQSALAAYETDNYTSASVIATENLSKLREPIKTFLEANGMSMGKLLGTLEDGLEANRVISAINTDKQATAATSDFIEVPDHAIRHRYLETASKWLGVEKEKNETNVQINMKVDFLDYDSESTFTPISDEGSQGQSQV